MASAWFLQSSTDVWTGAAVRPGAPAAATATSRGMWSPAHFILVPVTSVAYCSNLSFDVKPSSWQEAGEEWGGAAACIMHSRQPWHSNKRLAATLLLANGHRSMSKDVSAATTPSSHLGGWRRGESACSAALGTCWARHQTCGGLGTAQGEPASLLPSSSYRPPPPLPRSEGLWRRRRRGGCRCAGPHALQAMLKLAAPAHLPAAGCALAAFRVRMRHSNTPAPTLPLAPLLPVGGAGGPKLGSVAAGAAGEGFSLKALSGGETGGLKVGGA